MSYDHPDIYPTREDYAAAFSQFEAQSDEVILEPETKESLFMLAGEARRTDAGLALEAVKRMASDAGMRVADTEIIGILNEFPGVGRRFEKLANGIYTDYAHHPEEILATIDVARDEARLRGFKGVVAVYQPHQNVRQHEVRDGYYRAFEWADKVYWLPTYLTREDPSLEVLTPEDLISGLINSSVAEPAEMSDALFAEMMNWVERGYLVILMTAGKAYGWLRGKIGG